MQALVATSWVEVGKLEPSGLAVAPEGLWVVGDEGRLALLEPNTGDIQQLVDVKPRGDLEGVGLLNGVLHVLEEKRGEIWRIEEGRRTERWKAPKTPKGQGYEGFAVLPARLALSVQGKKRSLLRMFAHPEPGEKLRMLAEQTIDLPDLAGLCFWSPDSTPEEARLLALSDRERCLLELVERGDRWDLARRWRTPVRDLEGLAVVGEHLVLAQDSGGLWRAPWPPDTTSDP